MNVRMTDSACPVCGSAVAERRYDVENRPPELMVFGPGSGGNFSIQTDYYCSNESCCVVFHSLPKPKKREAA